MKKISVLLCIAILMLTFSFVTFAEQRSDEATAPSLSAPAVYIVPAERESVSCVVSDYLLPVFYEISVTAVKTRGFEEYKYFPYIMEQIDIISVAPRE